MSNRSYEERFNDQFKTQIQNGEYREILKECKRIKDISYRVAVTKFTRDLIRNRSVHPSPKNPPPPKTTPPLKTAPRPDVYGKLISNFQYNDLRKIVGDTKFNQLVGYSDAVPSTPGNAVSPPSITTDSHINQLYNKLVIFVPYCDHFTTFIDECIKSIDTQNYPNYDVVIGNDGGTLPIETTHTVLNFKKNRGPAFAKWKFIEYARDRYAPNDIVMIVDGDDYLFENSLFTINDTYNKSKCWSTFGNAFGKWADISTPSVNWGDVRNGTWSWSHPRTFRIELLSHFTESDFKYKGSWMPKCTDRELIYSINERCGKEKVSFIQKQLYYYREHDNNTYKTVKSTMKNELLVHCQEQIPCRKHIEDIHIVMLCWKRHYNLADQFTMLNDQICDRHIHLHIVNNNYEEKDKLESLVASLESVFTVHISHYKNELTGFQRFPYIRDVVLNKFLADYVIIIDDDEIFDSGWVQNMYDMRKPETYCGWYTKAFTRHSHTYTTDSLLSYDDLCMHRKRYITNLQYVGTGGCIIDTAVFLPDSELWNIPDDFDVYNVEDIWLSYICKEYYAWTLARSFLPPVIIKDEDKTTTAPCVSQWKHLKQKKNEFLNYLVEHKDYFID